MKKLKILQKLPYSSPVSSGIQYLCIEEESKNNYVLNVRERETLGDIEELKEKLDAKLIDEHGEQWLNEAYDSGEIEIQHESISLDYCDGKKVIEIQDGQFLLGEKLICFDDKQEIKFLQSQENEIELIVRKFINNLYRSDQINESYIIDEVRRYIKKNTKKMSKKKDTKTGLTFEVINEETLRVKIGRATFILDCSKKNDAKFTKGYGSYAGSGGKIQIKSQSKIWKRISDSVERYEFDKFPKLIDKKE